MTAAPAQRVLFHGVTGSGKTSAAHAYSLVTGVPEFSADDDLGWLPGWEGRPVEDQYRIAATTAAQDRWVLDSAYSSWRDIVLRRALAKDSIIGWHFRTFTRKRQAIGTIRVDPSMPPVLSFRRPGDLDAWIAAGAHAPPTVGPALTE
ncbi:hypothetical protein [Arthrobacter sp. L77]|uniref:hypothetical protein n=1 Tax=Arthrobacter sp. L77 TaxID=1496689 RepID=UPI0005BE42F0|nr:hypothetical protein [Arthrobacter sp. L77]